MPEAQICFLHKRLSIFEDVIVISPISQAASVSAYTMDWQQCSTASKINLPCPESECSRQKSPDYADSNSDTNIFNIKAVTTGRTFDASAHKQKFYEIGPDCNVILNK